MFVRSLAADEARSPRRVRSPPSRRPRSSAIRPLPGPADVSPPETRTLLVSQVERAVRDPTDQVITTIRLEIAQSSHAAHYSISRNYSTTPTPPLGSDPRPLTIAQARLHRPFGEDLANDSGNLLRLFAELGVVAFLAVDHERALVGPGNAVIDELDLLLPVRNEILCAFPRRGIRIDFLCKRVELVVQVLLTRHISTVQIFLYGSVLYQIGMRTTKSGGPKLAAYCRR